METLFFALLSCRLILYLVRMNSLRGSPSVMSNCGVGGQPNNKSSSFTQTGLKGDGAAMLFHNNIVSDEQTLPSTFADGFSCVKWLE